MTLSAKRPGASSATGTPRRGAHEAEGREVRDVALDAEVEVFEVLAHDDEVDALGPRERAARAGPIAHGTHVRVGALAPAQVEERRARSRRSSRRRAWRRRRRSRRGPRRGRAGGRGSSAARPTDGLHPLDVRREPAEHREARPHRFRRGVLALDHDDAAAAHVASPAPCAASRRRSTSRRPPASRIASMSGGPGRRGERDAARPVPHLAACGGRAPPRRRPRRPRGRPGRRGSGTPSRRSCGSRCGRRTRPRRPRRRGGAGSPAPARGSSRSRSSARRR